MPVSSLVLGSQISLITHIRQKSVKGSLLVETFFFFLKS